MGSSRPTDFCYTSEATGDFKFGTQLELGSCVVKTLKHKRGPSYVCCIGLFLQI